MSLLTILWAIVALAVLLSGAGLVSMVASRLTKRVRDHRVNATRAKLLIELTQPDSKAQALARILRAAARNGSLAGILLQVNGVVRGRMRDEYFARLSQAKAVDLLADLSRRADALGRVRAIEALSAFNGEAASAALKSLWRARPAKVRYAALSASAAREAGPAFEHALTMALRAKRHEAQLAAGVLRRLAAAKTSDALFWLDRMEIASRIAKPLVEGLGDAPARADVIAALSRLVAVHPAPEVRAAAVGSLVRQHTPDADVFRAALDDEAWAVRVRAVAALGKMRASDAGEALTQRLDDPNWWVRQRAAEALEELAAAGLR